MPLPEQTVSIVDELKKRGFTLQAGERLPFFGLRQSLYDQSGLKSALGEFTGTSAQNLKLLENIQKQNITPQSLGLAPAVPAVPVAPSGTPATSALTTAGLPQPQRLPTAEELGIPKRISEADVLAQIGQVPGTSATDVLATARGGLEAQIAARKGQEAITAGEAGAQAKAEQFGSRGLFFSGARISAEGAVRATAMSKKMGIDESLTRFIIQQQEAGDKATAQRIKDIVNDAVRGNEKARSEAITALSGLGYVVMPSGQIVLKPSETRATETEARAIRGAEIREENLQLAKERLILAKQKAQLVGQFLSGQLADKTYDDIILGARQDIQKSVGADRFIDPGVFLNYRNEIKKSMPGKLDDFDKEFVPRLSQKERDRLGVFVPSTKNTKVQMQAALDLLLAQPGILE